MHAVLEAIGAALRCAELFFVGIPAAALLSCWLAQTVARRDKGVFEFSDGLVFGALGGGIGGLAVAGGCAMLFRVNTQFRDRVSLAVSGLILGAIIGGVVAVVSIWQREARQRRADSHRDRSA